MAQLVTPPALCGELLRNEPMSAHTSWRVGGPARQFFRPANLDDLVRFLQQLPAEEPVLWVGLGSNLLVRDGGFHGTVISLVGRLNSLQKLDEERISVDAGASCAAVARFASRNGLGGAEFLAGIPGSMGGALAMNAGAFGGETWPLVESVDLLNRAGEISSCRPSCFQIDYRSVTGLDGEWFVRAVLRLKPQQLGVGERVRGLLDRRNQTQPIGVPSCGSVFMNPPGDHAARLIEAAGLKGQTIGGAQVSSKHANFIINTGNASATDIEAMIRHVRETVQAQFGVELHTEVRIVGEWA